MFRIFSTDEFYVCVASRGGRHASLRAFKVEPHQVVDIIHAVDSDVQTSWDALARLARGETLTLNDLEVKRFLRLGIDSSHESIEGLRQIVENKDLDRSFYVEVTMCNQSALRRLRRISEQHVRTVEAAADGIIAFRRYGKASMKRVPAFVRRLWPDDWC